MMHVVVHNSDSPQTARSRRRSGDGDVVEQTEPHRAISLGVMAGGPDQRQCTCAGVAIEHVFDRGNCRTSGEVCRRERARRGERIGIERHGAAGRLLDGSQIVSVMNPSDLHVRHTAWRLDVSSALAEFRGHDLHDLETLDALGMTRGSEMIGEMR